MFLHAHPDDETSQTAGMMALAAREGHRVVTVFATNGDYGERPEHLGDDGDLVEHRRGEARAAARVLGVERVDWLEYRDSGMTGWEQNSDPLSLHQASIDEAGTDEVAGRLARILDREDADVLVGYDYRGNYGHPDHLAVHRVARRAVDLAARRPRLLEAAGNRTAQLEMLESPEAARFLEVLADGGVAVDLDKVRKMALLQRLAAVRGRLSLCADQAAAAKWWLSMPMASVSAEGPMPKALSTRRTSPLMPGCRHQGRACPLRRARMTSNPLIVA